MWTLGGEGVNGGGELLLRQLQTIFLVELIGLLKGSELKILRREGRRCQCLTLILTEAVGLFSGVCIFIVVLRKRPQGIFLSYHEVVFIRREYFLPVTWYCGISEKMSPIIRKDPGSHISYQHYGAVAIKLLKREWNDVISHPCSNPNNIEMRTHILKQSPNIISAALVCVLLSTAYKYICRTTFDKSK